jgi:hypothetical protein
MAAVDLGDVRGPAAAAEDGKAGNGLEVEQLLFENVDHVCTSFRNGCKVGGGFTAQSDCYGEAAEETKKGPSYWAFLIESFQMRNDFAALCYFKKVLFRRNDRRLLGLTNRARPFPFDLTAPALQSRVTSHDFNS